MDGRVVTSCLILGVEADGRLHPLREVFVTHGVVQCGFCTPGMILSAKAFLETHRSPSREEVKRAMVGNLCRCTGYMRIIDTIVAAGQRMSELE